MPRTLGSPFHSSQNSNRPSVNILCDLPACLSSSVSLSFLCVQEYKESPRSERISHSERGEDRHGLPSTEDHISSDSEGNDGPVFIHAHKNTKCGEKHFFHSWSNFRFHRAVCHTRCPQTYAVMVPSDFQIDI